MRWVRGSNAAVIGNPLISPITGRSGLASVSISLARSYSRKASLAGSRKEMISSSPTLFVAAISHVYRFCRRADVNALQPELGGPIFVFGEWKWVDDRQS